MITYQRKTEGATQLFQVMERLSRYFVPGQVQHIIQRGNNRGVIFVASEENIVFVLCPHGQLSE